MRGVLPAAAVLLVASTLTSCVGGPADDGCAAPVSGTVEFVSSSVPPPYHYEWTLTLAAATGDPIAATMHLTPGYRAEEHWRAEFAVSADAATGVCTTLRGITASEPAPGSNSLISDLRDGAGGTVGVTTAVMPDQPPATNVLALVPADVWASLQGSYRTWQEENGG